MSTPKLEWLYHYMGRVHYIADGDTQDVDVDLGFGESLVNDPFGTGKKGVVRFRLHGVDTWEKRGKEKPLGKLATERAFELLPPGTWVLVRSIKDGSSSKGKYGRYLAKFWLLDGPDGEPGTCYNDLLIEEGHAVPYGTKKAVIKQLEEMGMWPPEEDTVTSLMESGQWPLES